MKTVFTSHEIAHIWAHQLAPYGCSPRAVSFDGPAILSYATVIGRIISSKAGTAYLLDTYNFSPSTSKHQGRIRWAIPEGATVFHMEFGERGQRLNYQPAGLVAHLLAKREEVKPESGSRLVEVKKARAICAKDSLLTQAIEIATFFRLPLAKLRKLETKASADVLAARAILCAYDGKLNAARAKREETERLNNEATERGQAAKAIEYAEAIQAGTHVFDTDKLYAFSSRYGAGMDRLESRPELLAFITGKIREAHAQTIQDWRNGKFAGHSSRISDLPAMLRISPSDPATVETSKGARFPLADAERAFRFAIARRSIGWKRNGETCVCGGYQLDAINSAGIVAGCHRIAWEEVESFATAQKWIGSLVPASEIIG